MPIMASCGMRARWPRMVENTPAPMNVNPGLIQYTSGACGSPPLTGSRIAIAAPSAAIWASDRSTKMTPRSTTCTPRYEWIPVRMRLAANGASRNCRGSRSILAGSHFLDGVAQQLDVVVEERDEVVDALLAAHRRRRLQD